MNFDTTDLTSYYPGYDEYCEPKGETNDDDFDIDAIIDERRLQEMEEKESKKEVELFKVVFTQGAKSGQFEITTYHNEFLEKICKQDPSTFLATKKTILQSLENIERKVKEGENGSD